LGWVDWALARAGWAKTDLAGFVATRGPGSFTGIRIGLGTIRGLALAAARPCAGVSVLEALAEAHGPGRGDRVALIGAGRGEVYGQRF
jgi:tRNA threonylcarbamoyladenosine biosynthesis protein TsaB